MRKYSIIVLLFLVFSIILTNRVEAESHFSDIPSDYWASDEIEFLTSEGIIKGYTDGTFKPGASITRAQAAIMLSRALDLSLANRPNPEFKDVNRSLVGYDEILAAVDEGIFTNKTYFYPDVDLTRGEMARALVVGYDLTGDATASFVDVTDSHPYHTYINLIAEKGISTGFSDGTFRPDSPVTRAEFSSFMYRVIQQMNIEEPIPSEPVPEPEPKPQTDFNIVDEEDNVVASFKTRDEAIDYVMYHDGTKVAPPDNKKFLNADDTGITNGVLIYNGFETNAKLAKEGKFPEHFFDTYVAYEKDGEYVDRFFDTFIILGTRYPEGIFQQSYERNTSDYSDWTWYLERTFQEHGAIDRLNESALRAEVGPVKVYMAIPYPKNHYTFTTPEGLTYPVNSDSRLDIVKWYISEVENRMKSGEYEGIEFAGFYWTNETINLTEDEALLKEVSQYLHSNGYNFVFSPHSGAANLQNWEDYGFDAAYLQSNAFKIRDNYGMMLRKLHEGYIRSLQFGTGVNLEIENSGVDDVEVSFQNLRAYLRLGELYDLSGKSMIMYQGTEMIYRLTKVDNPEYKEMYDELYNFFKSTRVDKETDEMDETDEIEETEDTNETDDIIEETDKAEDTEETEDIDEEKDTEETLVERS